MKNFIACLLLLAVCSCSTPKPPPAPTPPPVTPPVTPNLDPRMAVFSLIQPTFQTNTLSFEWNAPIMDGVIGYNFYYGTDTNNYFPPIRLGIQTNTTFISLDKLVDPIKGTYLTTLPNKTIVTNLSQLVFAVTALYDPSLTNVWQINTNGDIESDLSVPIFWPPPPAPPWSAVIVSWPSNRVVNLLVGNLKTPPANWTPLPNPTGTNVVILPLLQNGVYFRGVTTDAPPVILQIRGAYINGTN